MRMMNENRREAYLKLIEALLDCSSDEEGRQIWNANRELIDEGLVQTMRQLAEKFAQEGKQNAADFLANAATKLGEVLELSKETKKIVVELPEMASQKYGHFLVEVLNVIGMSEEVPLQQAVYSILEKNIEKLDYEFAILLRTLVIDNLSKIKSGNLEHSVGVSIANFSDLIYGFPLGNRANNLEIAITGYEIAATLMTYQNFPQDWASIQNSLGNVYCDRLKGKKRENVEKAIPCFLNALKVYTCEDFPEKWISIQANLGYAYHDRIQGKISENLEKAICCFSVALEVCNNRDDLSEQRAKIKHDLGLAYLFRIFGQKTENLEVAIRYFSEALKECPYELDPQRWADFQNNMGLAYYYRIMGEKAKNLEEAIRCFSNILKEYTYQSFPENWARAKFHLGLVYNERIMGKRAENLETAIGFFFKSIISL
jgi:tetratricopeptide (TPR) repeat protein